MDTLSFNFISYEEIELEELLLRVMSYGFKVLWKSPLEMENEMKYIKSNLKMNGFPNKTVETNFIT